jgi:hypothetical protein
LASDGTGTGGKPDPAEQDTPFSKALTAEASDRLADARAIKAQFQAQITEAYFFAAPERSRQISSETAAPTTPPMDQAELQISIAMEESENFSTTLIQSFMPPGMPWCDLKPTSAVPDIFMDEVKEKAKAEQIKVFQLINESNFYATLPGAMNPDASVGLFALMIESGKLHEPVNVMAVPLRELDVNIGPNGDIDDRFVTRHTKARFIKTLVGKSAVLSKKILGKIDKRPNEPATVKWGFWRCWDDDKFCWQKVVLVDDEMVFASKLYGDGSCPLLPIPFNRHPEFPIGSGPLLKAAPELRVLDDMTAGEVDNIDLSLRPPMTYPDDSFVNVEQGVEPGAWYPIRPGTQDAVKKMYEPNKLDAVYFDQAKREQRIRRMFYNDFPQQRGDTPPTATQWLDEMAMAQRKMGTPGLKFWDDCPAAVFKRFMFIARQRGLVSDINVGNKAYSLAPDNPTKRAQDQQRVAMVVRGAQIGVQVWPEEFKAGFDGAAAMTEIFDLLGVSDIVKKRNPADIQNAVSMIQKLQGGDPTNTTVQPGQLGGPAPAGPAGAPQ